MSYVESILQPGERIVHRTGPHWYVYLPAAILAVLAIIAIVVAGQASSRGDAYLPLILFIAGAVLAVFALGWWLRAFLRRWSTELVATNRRIVYKTGLLSRHTAEMSLDKVESIDVDQSMPGRLLDYGTVTVRGTGGGIEPLLDIAGPITFRNHVTAI
jgi:uncharacterized membrane protein YdbT with pleckstrin-like domain